ncbi:hypothetical protein [Polycladomyces subterraneus]|jgi:hypothetical protein|uniref:Uncharacterized protein n=1 Tax=Polycladomyces subterraneus TaxID=1016997 RepID=A0ABT8IN11_9BACL|nr:hypothetical protein [Polycladomyces subterraneus]MDN4594200.1 hypothetical protein [Polycladomyces subterraneus]
MKVMIGAVLVVWLLLSLRLRQPPLMVAKQLSRMILLVLVGFLLLSVAWRLGKLGAAVGMIGGLVILLPLFLGILKRRKHISS